MTVVEGSSAGQPAVLYAVIAFAANCGVNGLEPSLTWTGQEPGGLLVNRTSGVRVAKEQMILTQTANNTRFPNDMSRDHMKILEPHRSRTVDLLKN